MIPVAKAATFVLFVSSAVGGFAVFTYNPFLLGAAMVSAVAASVVGELAEREAARRAEARRSGVMFV